MPAGEIDDASAAEEAPGAPGHFPGFVKFFAGETAGAANGPGNTVEQCRAGKTRQVVLGEPRLAAGVEVIGRMSSGRAT
jgi:hypothetical protein